LLYVHHFRRFYKVSHPGLHHTCDDHATGKIRREALVRWSISVPSCESTRCCHRAFACAISAQQMPWSLPSPWCENTLSYFFTKKPGTIWDPKRTLYSAHCCDEFHLNVKYHNWSWRACEHF
jgi:hypothetical protein